MVTTPEIWRAAISASDIDPILGNARPDIIQLANGDIIVGWSSSNQAGAGSSAGVDIVGVRYNWVGTRQGGEIQMNFSRTIDDEADIQLASVPNGDYLQLYVDRDAGSSTLMVERKDMAGVHEATSIVASDAISNHHGFFDIAVASNTSAVIFYTKNENELGTQDTIYSRSYNPTTGAMGVETFVIQNGTFSDDILSLKATALSNGNYAFVIQADAPSGDDEIWVAVTDSTGALSSYYRLPATMSNTVADIEPTISALSGCLCGRVGGTNSWQQCHPASTL